MKGHEGRKEGEKQDRQKDWKRSKCAKNKMKEDDTGPEVLKLQKGGR